MDRLIRNARLTSGQLVDIEISNSLIERIVPATSMDAPVESHDVGGRLILPAMAEPHAHLDKALTAELIPNPTGDLSGAIDSWTARAHLITEEDTDRRARLALDKLIVSGVTAVRTHVNCGDQIGPASVRILDQVRQDYVDLIDLEIVALPSCPMTGTAGAGNRAALAAGIEAGATLIGGCPHLDEDGIGLIEVVLDAASDAGLGVDLHVDETLDVEMLTLRDLARLVQQRGFDLPVTASHCVSLGMQTLDTQRAVSVEVAAAGISIIALPQTNLFLQGHHHPTAMPRGLTAVAALREAGVLVAAGADNVQDPFNLVGRSDPLETAALLVMAGHVLPTDAYDLVSNNAREAMGLGRISLSEGDPADLVAIDAPSLRSAIADAPMSRSVFRGGRLVASSSTTTTIHR